MNDTEYKAYCELINNYLLTNSKRVYPNSNEWEIESNIVYHGSYMAMGLMLLRQLAEIPETRAILKELLQEILKDEKA